MKQAAKAFFALLIFTGSLSAQDIVDINLDVKHSVNGVSVFDRSKYIMIHASALEKEWPSEARKAQFLYDYDVYLGRNNGSLPWYLSICEEDPEKPGWPSESFIQSKGNQAINEYKYNTIVHQYEDRLGHYMIGGQEGMYPNGEHEIGPNGGKWYLAKEGYHPLAEYYANYLKYFHGTGGTNGQPMPTYLEVMNEPFVKSDELHTTNANLSEMHRIVALRVKELNPNIKVGGYSAAHPAFEASNFAHWENNWKQFIDIAGAEMDFFSVHLYDNLQDNGEPGQYRAGSNIEAILDMIEHYSYLKLGEVKPFCISEYGCLAADDGRPYTRERDWNNIRSFSTIMMQLMEKQDIIDQALPFLLVKASWWTHESGNRYPHRLFRQQYELEGETGTDWVYTEVVKFFQLWSNVNGIRIDSWASSPDIQADGYVEGNKAYLIVNNMHHEARMVDLNIQGLGDAKIESVFIKHLHAENDGLPQLDQSTLYAAPGSIDIGREATCILEYNFDREILIPDSSAERKYYADKYYQAIIENQAIEFDIDQLNRGDQGEAVLRLGVGRGHGRSLQPTVIFNDSMLIVPSNLRGDEQVTRDQFFGVIEIPVPHAYLRDSNTVSVTFPDATGHISSLSLQVFNFSKEIQRAGEQIWGVSLSEDSRIMKPGKQFQLKAKVTPVNFENKNISWHSSDTAIVKVTATGLIETFAEGTAMVIVTTEVDQLSDTCFFQVSASAPEMLAESIKILPNSLSLLMDHSSQLSAEVLPLDVDIKEVSWHSSQPDIASVDEKGIVNGNELGSAYIHASTTDGSMLSDSVKVYVNPLPNTVDCSLIPTSIESDSILTFEINYTLGDTMDIAIEMIKNGSTLSWIADSQLSVEPGAGTISIPLKIKDKESGKGTIPYMGSYLLLAHIREVGGDASTNSGKCFKTIFLLEHVGDTTDVPDLKRSFFDIYPNPASQQIEIRGQIDEQTQITVFNMQGISCIETEVKIHRQLDISSLPRGAYFLQIRSQSYSQTKLFIKE